MTIITILSLLVLISAIVAIIFHHQKRHKTYTLAKGLTTVLIIIISVFVYGAAPGPYSAIMIGSLFFALLGDVFLTFKDYFVKGLIAFLVAQLGFTAAFISVFGFNYHILPLVLLAVIFVLYYNYLKKSLRNLAVPVAIYMVALMIMNWQAIGLVLREPLSVFYAIAAGALLFSFSDALLVYETFKKKTPLTTPVILLTYWIAIYLFAVAGLYIG